MTEELAIKIAAHTAEENEFGNDYSIRYRHIQLPARETIEIMAYNQALVFVDPSDFLEIHSKMGVFYLKDDRINEMQYVHKGKTTIVNHTRTSALPVKFIQIIPKR